MSKYASRAAMGHKANWEGGLEEFIFGYGISPSDAPDAEVEALLVEILSVSTALDRLRGLLDDAVEAAQDEDG